MGKPFASYRVVVCSIVNQFARVISNMHCKISNGIFEKIKDPYLKVGRTKITKFINSGNKVEVNEKSRVQIQKHRLPGSNLP